MSMDIVASHRIRLPIVDALRARYADEVGAGASLEDIFFHVTEGQVPEDGDGPADAPRPADAGAAA